MRIIISFTFLFLFSACHNKNDLKRIDDLEKENKKLVENNSSLRDEIMQIKNAQSKSINNLHDFTNKDARGYLDAFNLFAINKPVKNNIKLNKEIYNANMIFCVNNNFYVHQFSHSIPQKSKNLNSYQISLNNNSFSFMPKDTGWFYWKGIIQIKNYRTDNITKYPIIDSFYVYK